VNSVYWIKLKCCSERPKEHCISWKDLAILPDDGRLAQIVTIETTLKKTMKNQVVKIIAGLNLVKHSEVSVSLFKKAKRVYKSFPGTATKFPNSPALQK